MSDRNASTGQTDVDGPPRRALGGELIIPVGTVLFAIYYIYTVWGLSWQAAAAGIGITGAMAVVLVILGVRLFQEWRRSETVAGFGELIRPTSALAYRLGLLALAIAFINVMPFLGFTISLFFFLVAAIMMLSGLTRVRAAFVIAAVVSIGGYLLFVLLIGARFPEGHFERIVGGLL